ncbi:MAG: hypothetical protein E7Z84_01285 [Methanosphaera stadtmanae]|nr:hypothetical protein [Methanosphaera stadtmanae]
MSRIKIGVFGSCGNRDMFNSDINPNYKQDFSITFSYVSNSIINAMSPPIKYSENDLLDLNGNELGKVPYKLIKKILDRNVMRDLVNSHIDYLLLDFYLETLNGVYLLDDNVIYNSHYIRKSKLYSKLEDKQLVKMSTDMELFMDLFKENFEKFYSQIEKKLPDLTLILNPIRESYKIQQDDNSIKIKEPFKNSKNNYYCALVDKWVLNNYDIESLIIKNYNLSQNHKWGLGPTHYVPEYYKETSQQIKELTQRIEFLNQQNQAQINKDIRLTRNNYNLLKIDELLARDKYKNTEERLNDTYNKYNQQNEELEHYKKRCEELNEENQKLNNLLSEVLSSNSWKVTSPLRKLKNKL